MRVIAGSLKGKKLNSVSGRTIRPTSDRLRESIFNIISYGFQGAVVLDLFAGTGALGIEALSRGAESAVFIDNTKDSLSVIEKNIRSCALENRTKIIKWNIVKNLNCLRQDRPAFNYVFMDPPYNKNTIEQTLFNLHQSSSLEKGAVIIVEHSPFEPIPGEYLEYNITDQRRYGKSLVSFLNYMI